MPSPQRGESVLRLRRVSKSYPDRNALSGVDLDVAAGEIVALVGPNGAGKTTLLSIVAGLRRLDQGEVWVAGLAVGGNPRSVQGRVGLAQQDLALYPTSTVRENLELFGRLAGLRRSTLRTRVTELASALSLLGDLDRQARHLSGGERRRLHVGVAMLSRPPLLLLDEPTASLDVQQREALWTLVRSVAAEGTAVVLATNQLAEAEGVGDRVVVLDDGRVIADDTPKALVALYGGGGIRARFRGNVPGAVVARFAGAELAGPGREWLWIPTEQPADVVAELVRALGQDAERLTSVAVERPSLEAVYLRLAGKPYPTPEPERQDEGRVGA
jgi:ABC-2 type transport system ATP-binding protein